MAISQRPYITGHSYFMRVLTLPYLSCVPRFADFCNLNFKSLGDLIWNDPIAITTKTNYIDFKFQLRLQLHNQLQLITLTNYHYNITAFELECFRVPFTFLCSTDALPKCRSAQKVSITQFNVLTGNIFQAI